MYSSMNLFEFAHTLINATASSASTSNGSLASEGDNDKDDNDDEADMIVFWCFGFLVVAAIEILKFGVLIS